MRIIWVTRSFLDYRLPLYRELATFPGVEFHLLAAKDRVPEALREETVRVLGDRVDFLVGEKCFGAPYKPEQTSNSVRRVFWQPGLAKRIMATKPDVVITDAFNHWTLPVLHLRGRYKFKHIVCYERTAHTERNAPWLKKRFIRFAGRRIDAIHYNGVLCHDFLRGLGYPEYKLKPGNMTVDVRNFAQSCEQTTANAGSLLKKSLGITTETVFLFVGQLIPRKGLRQFLHGWRQWRKNHPDAQAKFLIVGSGSEEQQLKDFCTEQQLDEVIFAGSCKNSEVPKYLAISDVFVIPTLEDNWSLVVPEAMSCGKPILCSCYNGCHPELVHEGKNGWVFDPRCEENIADKLHLAYQSRGNFAVMGEASRKIVRLYCPEEIAAGILRTCREKTAPPRSPMIPRIIEFGRSKFDHLLMKKSHWGCVAHYRRMMKINSICNRRAEGERAYLAQWRKLSRDVAKEDYRLFSKYTKVNASTVPESVSHNIVEAILVPAKFRPFYADKNMFDLLMPRGVLAATYLRRMGGAFRSADYELIKEEDIDLDRILHDKTRCVIKPTIDSSSGHGVTIFEKRDGVFCALNGEMKDERLTLNGIKRFFGSDFIVQEYLEQSEFMNSLCSTSVNTIRLFVYRSVKTEQVVVPAIIMRLGHEGSLVDNSHAGGVSIGVDREGNLGHYATDQYGQRYSVVNGIDFANADFQIPDFPKVIELAENVGRHLLHCRMANLDVMIGKDGLPRLVEYNLSSMSTWLYQFDSGNAYGEYAEEIIEYCKEHLGEARHVLIEY